jgi:hypothetical protein
MNTTPDPSQEDEEDSRTLVLRWAPGNVDTKYVNHLMITFTDTEFYLTFGEVVPPVVIDGQPLADLPDFVEVTPVVRLAVSPAAMLKVAQTIDRQVGRFVERFSTFGDAT